LSLQKENQPTEGLFEGKGTIEITSNTLLRKEPGGRGLGRMKGEDEVERRAYESVIIRRERLQHRGLKGKTSIFLSLLRKMCGRIE